MQIKVSSKVVVIAFLIVGLITIVLYTKFTSNAMQDWAPPVTERKIIFEVEGMTCGNCSDYIDKVVNGFDGVVKSTSNYKEGTTEVEFSPGLISPDSLKSVINGTGFTVKSFETRY